MWNRSKLGKYLVGDDIMLPGNVSVDINFFEALFAEAITAGGTYAEFIASDYAVDENGNVIRNRGYRAFFDQLKVELSLISVPGSLVMSLASTNWSL